ncbi:YadA-like family protein [Paraburkholderia sp. Ac-20336]|uniref:YadA family autotransporter adhesin n=2 Tax=Burkholderiales TaxID=80840 RepID=UPI001F119F6B|nr:YadA-like family protein [Paraburkholderia sp. Ac-20336]
MNNNKITALAAGTVSATSTDAINGSQLYAATRYFQANSTLADATAAGADSVALGPQSVSTGPSSVAIGNGATANNASDVALGAGSSTAAPHTGAFDLSGGTAAATAPVSVVSVGAAGSERQIQNVAAGVLSATSTDAVNGSQLFSVASAGNATGTSVAAALGGGSTYTPGVGVSAPSYTIGGTIFNNVGAALTGLDTDLTNLQNAVGDINDGSGIRYFRSNSTAADSQATGIDSIAIAPLAIASGADSFAAGTGAQAQAINSLAFGPQSVASVADSVAIGSGSVADRPVVPGVGEIPNGGHAIPYNTSDLTLLGAVSFGNATTGTFRQLTNVADGTQPQDAVTIRQLAGALSAFAATGTRYFHANSTAVDSLAVGAESIAVGPTTVVNGDNGIGIGNGAIVNATAPGGVAIGEAANSNQADAIAIGSGSNASGAQSVAQGSLASATQSGAVAVGSGANSSAVDSLALGAGSTASFANSVALGAGSVTTVGALSNYIAYGLSSPQSSAGEVNVGNRQITGVAGGSAGNDAVNVSQLDAVATHLTELIKQQTGGGGDFSSNPVGPQIPPGATGPNSAAGGSGSVASGANSTATGGHSTAAADNSTALGSGASATGNNSVALGANSDDGGRTNVVSVGSATNQRQVANVAAGTLPTDAVNVQQLNAGLAQANAYTDQRAAQLQDGINSTARYAYAGIAAATALTMIPEVDPGKTLSLGVGTAGYRGYQAVAIGGTARISESIKVKAGFGTSAAGTTVGVGAAMQW